MVLVLAVSDEVDEGLLRNPGDCARAELILACGDLPMEYLEALIARLDVPLVFVPGNHDREMSGYRESRAGLTLRAGLPERAPWPAGAVNADGRVVDVAGLRIAGLGGSLRYRDGPNQYSEGQQRRRARRLCAAAAWRRLRDGRGVDVLLTHAPPRGVGDRDDASHRGFEALVGLAHRMQPPLLLHGHIHPFGEFQPPQRMGSTLVRNVVGKHLLTIPVPTDRDQGYT
jgi:calcineurin-like phosphoesterase family protein